MRRIKEVLRLAMVNGLSERQICVAARMKKTTTRDYILRARHAHLTWETVVEKTDEEIEQILFPVGSKTEGQKQAPNWAEVHRELRRKGVTLQLLWEEYRDRTLDGYAYSHFCELYRQFAVWVDVSMRQHHRAGEKVFVDYSGQTGSIIDRDTGEIKPVQIFVGVMGASNFTYAEATWTQSLPDWTGSHVRMFKYFGGVPALVVPDNLKSGISKAWFYDPEINPTYQRLAEHYGIAVLPTRVAKPKDKAKVEAGVLLVQRWILARLRNRQFFSLPELNNAIHDLLEQLNNRPFRKIEGSRQTLFETLDKPLLKSLPPTSYEFDEWKNAKLHIDYHVEFDHHHYSAPYQLRGRSLEVRATTSTVEIYLRGKRVACHARSKQKGGYTTIREHMPKHHQAVDEWSPDRLIAWGRKVGEDVALLMEAIMQSKDHPQQGFRPCLGIMRLEKKVGKDRLVAACRRALAINGLSYRCVEVILTKGQDRLPLPSTAPSFVIEKHENIRGAAFFNEQGDIDVVPTNH